MLKQKNWRGREIMDAMWKPRKFKFIYLIATLYVFTLTIPSATAVYWAFGDQLLTHSNAFSLLPPNGWRTTAVVLMLIHQVSSFLSKFPFHLFFPLFFFFFFSYASSNASCAVHNIWVCLYALVFRVGEGDRHA